MSSRWLPEEDEALKALFAKHGKKWGFISSQMENRSASQVAARWEKCLNPVLTKGCFTAEEDQIILEHVAAHGSRHWPVLSTRLDNRRSPKQCRERWLNHLAPGLNPRPWTAAEDEMLLAEHTRVGPHWVTIAQALPGRSDNAVKNRWNSSVKLRVQADAAGVQTLLPEDEKKPRQQRPPPLPPVLKPFFVHIVPAFARRPEQPRSGGQSPLVYISPGIYAPGCWTPPPPRVGGRVTQADPPPQA
jgi:hypothetical protein